MPDSGRIRPFPVEGLNVDRLLADWRWLWPERASLVARNVFGDLFLEIPKGDILWLDTCIGKLFRIARSAGEFFSLLKMAENREEWMAESQARDFADLGLRPNETQCIAFRIPLIFAESADAEGNAYLADLYEQVSFLGSLHRQLASVPDGTKIRLELPG